MAGVKGHIQILNKRNMLITVDKLIKLYKLPVLSKLARRINMLLGVDIPISVKFGDNIQFPHNSIGTVIHDNTTIEDNVKIYQNVTLGRADVYKNTHNSTFGGFVIKHDACICAGAKIICKSGVLTIGEYSVIAANAVLLNSTEPRQIWAGIPAKLVGYRDDITEESYS